MSASTLIVSSYDFAYDQPLSPFVGEDITASVPLMEQWPAHLPGPVPVEFRVRQAQGRLRVYRQQTDAIAQLLVRRAEAVRGARGRRAPGHKWEAKAWMERRRYVDARIAWHQHMCIHALRGFRDVVISLQREEAEDMVLELLCMLQRRVPVSEWPAFPAADFPTLCREDIVCYCGGVPNVVTMRSAYRRRTEQCTNPGCDVNHSMVIPLRTF
jgi:hypothetical protein